MFTGVSKSVSNVNIVIHRVQDASSFKTSVAFHILMLLVMILFETNYSKILVFERSFNILNKINSLYHDFYIRLLHYSSIVLYK